VSLLPSIFSRKRPRSPKVKRPVLLRLEYLEERCTPAVIVTRISDSAMFATIQAAIDDAGTVTGSTLLVSAGTDAEQVTINKSITLEGAQHGVDARTRLGAESSWTARPTAARPRSTSPPTT
jgi:pectin methylesterase-like acyl-CoA thioesterase